MNKLNKWILINCLVSFLMFCYIFYSHMSASGGDIAIYALNIIFGILQIIVVSILIWKKENTFFRIIFFIILLQIIEITIMTIWGYRIRAFLISF